jgi:hypothetical protein
MPDPIARKRLKKKMLDRWENEGGSISADPTSADEATQTSSHKGEGKQLSDSRDDGRHSRLSHKEEQAYTEMSRAQDAACRD